MNSKIKKHSKAHFKAKLDLDFVQMSQTKVQLVNYLDSEYRKLDKKYSKCIMLKRIRVSLIMNPYDQVGRKMASETKDLFKESILNERSTFDVLKRSLKVPNWILKQGWAKKESNHLCNSSTTFSNGDLLL